MGYSARNPTFSFRLGEYRTTKLKKIALAANMPAVDYLRNEIIDKFFNGSLIPKTKDDLTLQMETAKLEKIQLENKLLRIKINFSENFNQPLSRSGNLILARSTNQERADIETKSPYDESNNRIQCPVCNCLYTWINQNEFTDQIKEFSNHMKISHTRNLNALESDVIDNLQFTGISK